MNGLINLRCAGLQTTIELELYEMTNSGENFTGHFFHVDIPNDDVCVS